MALAPRQPPSPEAQAAKLRGILESAVTAIITIDDGGLIESINPATERLFGYGPAELIGQNVKVLMPEPYKAEHDGYLANYKATGVRKIIGIGREVSGRRKDGTTFPLHLSVSEFSADGRRYFTGMVHDLSAGLHPSCRAAAAPDADRAWEAAPRPDRRAFALWSFIASSPKRVTSPSFNGTLLPAATLSLSRCERVGRSP